MTRMARVETGDGRHLLLGGGQSGQHPDSVSREHMPRLGQPHEMPAPLDQRGPDPILEPVHHLRDHRLCETQSGRRACVAARLADGPDDPEPRAVDGVVCVQTHVPQPPIVDAVLGVRFVDELAADVITACPSARPLDPSSDLTSRIRWREHNLTGPKLPESCGEILPDEH